MELDSIFDEVSRRYIEPEKKRSICDKIVNDVENEFNGVKTLDDIRVDEKNDLLSKLEKYKASLKKLNNRKKAIKVTNASRRQRILEETNAKRIQIQNSINEIKLKLDDLAIECGEDDLRGNTNKADFYKPSGVTPYDEDFF